MLYLILTLLIFSQVEKGFSSSLKSTLSSQLLNYVQNSQYCIKKHYNCQKSTEDLYLDFPNKFDLDESVFINEPVRFNFSLSPKNIRERIKGQQKLLPFLNPINETWSSRLKILITAAAVINERLKILHIHSARFMNLQVGVQYY